MKTEEIKKMAHALLAVQESQFQYVVPEEIEAHERTAFHGAAAGAAKAGKSHFSFKGKKYPVTMKKDVATKIADSVEHDEEVEEINEEEMTKAQMKKREEIVKSMKDKEAEFKKNYGDRWKEVMYATATKMAMKEEVEEVEEANAPKGTHTPNNGSPMGQGLSPSAKKEVDNKTPISQEIDEPTVDKLNFQKFKTMTKKSPMRSGDNAKGDTAIKPGGTPMKDPAAPRTESYDLSLEEAMVSSGRAQHDLKDNERKGHADYMKKKHGVTTKFHGDDELSYHGPKANVKKALGTHYGGDHDHAKDEHPHIFKEGALEEATVSSDRAMHNLEDHERKAHADYMKKKHGVTTKFHGDDELSYHGPKANVKAALIRHYHNDKDHAKDEHPHIFKEGVIGDFLAKRKKEGDIKKSLQKQHDFHTDRIKHYNNELDKPKTAKSKTLQSHNKDKADAHRVAKDHIANALAAHNKGDHKARNTHIANWKSHTKENEVARDHYQVNYMARG